MYSLKDYIFQLKELLNYSTDKVLILNNEGKLVFVNDLFSDFSGFKKTDKDNLHLDKLFNSHDKIHLLNELKLNNFFLGSMHINFHRSKKKLELISFNIWNENKIIGHVILLPSKDKDSQDQKIDSLQTNILTAMNMRMDAVWYMTNIQNGRNTFTSASVKEILGWEPEYFNLGGWFFLFSIAHPGDIANLISRHAEWIMMKNKLGPLYDHVEYHNTFRIRNIKGDYISVETDSNVLERDEEGKIKLIFGSFRQIELDVMLNHNSNDISNNIKVIDDKIYIELNYLKQLREQKIENVEKKSFSNLTSREMEVLDLVVEEFSSEEISAKLNISIHTVNLHRKQIMKKLQAKNMAALIRIYYTAI